MLLSFPQSSPGQAVATKSGDQSKTNDTALADVTALGQAIGAGETWVFTWLLSAVFGTVGQIKVAVTVPSGATLLAIATMDPNGIVPAAGSATSSGAAIALISATSTAGIVTVTATVVNGSTAGNVQLQFAQNTTDGTATTIKSASSMVARRK
jgi:hypothetical protein